MAKKSHSGGPGTYASNGVRCTMDPPFKGGLSKGSQQDMSGTFDKGRSGGDNGLPTTVRDSMGGPKGGPAPSMNVGAAPTAQGYRGARTRAGAR